LVVIALIATASMIVQRNPVHSALLIITLLSLAVCFFC
jgi:NADH:ubiquinone oxidoreductase subunit 6 (subunit J)